MQDIEEAIQYLYEGAVELAGMMKPEERELYLEICAGKRDMLLEVCKSQLSNESKIKIRKLWLLSRRLEKEMEAIEV